VGAVLSVGFSPTGREFVSGGYDRMVRIWTCNQGRSREVYHTKRMGRVFCTNFSQVRPNGIKSNRRAKQAHMEPPWKQLHTRW
jgi:WD40 repeat protein